MHLADAVDSAAAYLLTASMEDRLAGSYPFLDRVSVMTCGGLMARQRKAATSDSAFDKAKRVTVRYYLDHLVPEALGKAAAATAGADILYSLSAAELAA